MNWKFDDNRPIYVQIAGYIESDIVKGKYPPGSKLMSVREFATIVNVNPNTMQKALTELEQEGLVFSSRTSGRFVTEDEKVILKRKDLLAKNYKNDFLAKMKEIGYSIEEIISIIKEEN